MGSVVLPAGAYTRTARTLASWAFKTRVYVSHVVALPTSTSATKPAASVKSLWLQPALRAGTTVIFVNWCSPVPPYRMPVKSTPSVKEITRPLGSICSSVGSLSSV